MIVAIRRSVGAAVVLVVAGCSAAAPSASPVASPVASVAVAESASAAPSPIASQPPASAPSASTPPLTPGPSTAGCPALPQTVALPSDRFTDIKAVPGAAADRLTFSFGDASLPGPPTPPQGTLQVARPPYTEATSGKAITIAGDQVVQVGFTGMSLANDVGQPTYDGRTDIRDAGTAFKQAVLFDASEGVIGWYVGYDGPGCTTMVVSAHDLTLVISHR